MGHVVVTVPPLTCSNCGSGDLATLLSAIAGIIVAVATLGVVLATFQSAKATKGLLVAQSQPQIVDVPPAPDSAVDDDRPTYPDQFQPSTPPPGIGQVTVGHENATVHSSVPIRNVGPGLAYIRDVFLGSSALSDPPWYISKRYLPSGERTRIVLAVKQGHPAYDEFSGQVSRGSVAIRVRYTAVGAEAVHEATFELAHISDEGWRVVDLQFAALGAEPKTLLSRLAVAATRASDSLGGPPGPV